jgi:VanZ family protein
VTARAYHAAVSTQVATTKRSALTLWLPVLAWAVVIFAFSSVPSLGTGLGTWDLVLRKLAHVSEYAVLGLLLARAVRRPALAVALGAGYAVTDEVHQTFVEGRHGTPRDVAIDTLGALVGVLVWSRWGRSRRA